MDKSDLQDYTSQANQMNRTLGWFCALLVSLAVLSSVLLVVMS